MLSKVFREEQSSLNDSIKPLSKYLEKLLERSLQISSQANKEYMITKVRIVETKRIRSKELIRNRVRESSINFWETLYTITVYNQEEGYKTLYFLTNHVLDDEYRIDQSIIERRMYSVYIKLIL